LLTPDTRTLKHVAQYSPLLGEEVRRSILASGPGFPIRDRYVREQLPLSELPYFLNGTYTLDVPVYTVWGACEDVAVLEKLRTGEYKINNLFVVDEAHSRLLEVGGLRLRLLGLGGAVVMHKLFDNGEGKSTIAGGQGTMWTTLLQIGELVDTATRSYDPSETRILITHASPAREALLNQLAVSLKVDFSISAGLHFRYGSSYNEFSVNPTLDHYRGKLAASKASFADVWDTVKNEVMPAVNDNEIQQRLLNFALEVVSKMPSTANGSNPFGGHGAVNNGAVDELAFKNMWNFNLADAAFGYLVLEVEGGRIGTEMRAQGFNFAHRSQKVPHPTLQADMIKPSLPSPMAGGPSPRPGSIISQPPPYEQQGAGQLPPQTQTRPIGAPITPGPIPQQGYQQARPQQPQAPVGRVQQPQQAPPQTQPIQPAPAKTPTSTTRPAAPVPSPAPAVAPAPSAVTPAATAPAATNGEAAATASSESKSDATPAPDANTDAASREQKPSTSIFITGVTSEEAARALFSEEDRAKLTRVQKRGIAGNAWLAWFNTPEEMQSVLAAAPPELKEYKRGQPQIKEGHVPDRGEYKPRGTGTWGQRSTSNTAGTNGASEGEAGRGRGGFRGRGGSMRGGRGRGRGGAGNGDAAPAPTATT